jgi:nucleotide-binding universal stress UspA family protein
VGVRTSRRNLVARGYRRLLVPLDGSSGAYEALDIACRLAADDHASVTAMAVVEVPPLLPLDAHLHDEEEASRRLLERAGATADSYGVKLTPKLVRTRNAGAAIVDQALSDRAELIVIGALRTQLATSPRRIAPDTLIEVLKAAPCRVMVVAAPQSKAA